MTNSIRQWFTRLAVALALWPASAEAQPTARSFAELIGIVKADETVVITDTRSRRVKGTLTSVDEDSLSLAADGRTQTFSRSEVSTVRVADGLGNGALIGAGAGLGAALAILATAGFWRWLHPSFGESRSSFTAVGYRCPCRRSDNRAHEGGRVLYVSPTQRSRLVVSPFLRKDRQGALRVREFIDGHDDAGVRPDATCPPPAARWTPHSAAARPRRESRD